MNEIPIPQMSTEGTTRFVMVDPGAIMLERMRESLRKRARVHERLGRRFRRAANELALSVKLIGEGR